MNSKNSRLRFLDADGLREVLGYSVQFSRKVFCVVVDAESFEYYDMVQLAYDLRLIVNSRNTKIIVIVGCFSTRMKRAKKISYPQVIKAASDELQKQLNSIIVPEISPAQPTRGGSSLLLPEQVAGAFENDSIAIVPAICSKNPELTSVISVDKILATLTESLEDNHISKVVILSDCDGIYGADREFLAQINSEGMKILIKNGVVAGSLAVVAETAIYAIEELSIKRVHIINGIKPDSLLLELFTKDGSGTMVYSGKYSEIRQAIVSDMGGIHSLLVHYPDLDMVLPHSLEEIGSNIGQFFVAIVDDFPIACARLRLYPDEGKAFLSSIAVNSTYISHGIGLDLLKRVVAEATTAKVKNLSLISKSTVPHWLPAAFKEGGTEHLPAKMQKQYAGGSPAVLVRDIS